MSTIEELEKQRLEQEALLKKQQEEELAKKAQEEEKAREFEAIPEPFRDKSKKDLVDMLLQTNLELERIRKEAIENLEKKTETTEADLKAQEEKEFISDPVTFLKKHTEARLKPLLEGYHEQQAEIQLQMAKTRKEDYPNFAKYEKQIRETLSKMPPELRSNPLSIDLAYKLAEYPDLKKRVAEASAREGLHTELGSPPTQPSKKKELTEEEKIVARRFGLTDDQYLEWSEKYEIE